MKWKHSSKVQLHQICLPKIKISCSAWLRRPVESSGVTNFQPLRCVKISLWAKLNASSVTLLILCTTLSHRGKGRILQRKIRPTRYSESFVPSAVRLLNGSESTKHRIWLCCLVFMWIARSHVFTELGQCAVCCISCVVWYVFVSWCVSIWFFAPWPPEFPYMGQ